MLYQLTDGRTIEMSIHDYLDSSDEELRSLIGYAHIGDVINNPLYGSAIRKPGRILAEDPTDFNDLSLEDIPLEHKLDEQDYTPDVE